MKAEKLYESLQYLDESILERSERKNKRVADRNFLIRVGSLAACFCIIAYGVYIYNKNMIFDTPLPNDDYAANITPPMSTDNNTDLPSTPPSQEHADAFYQSLPDNNAKAVTNTSQSSNAEAERNMSGAESKKADVQTSGNRSTNTETKVPVYNNKNTETDNSPAEHAEVDTNEPANGNINGETDAPSDVTAKTDEDLPPGVSAKVDGNLPPGVSAKADGDTPPDNRVPPELIQPENSCIEQLESIEYNGTIYFSQNERLDEAEVAERLCTKEVETQKEDTGEIKTVSVGVYELANVSLDEAIGIQIANDDAYYHYANTNYEEDLQ